MYMYVYIDIDIHMHTLLRNPRSCETMRTVRSQAAKKYSSQVSACTSRWLVGSSSSSRSGFKKSACEQETSKQM